MLRPSRRSAARPAAPAAPRPALSGDEPIVDRIELWTHAAARDLASGAPLMFPSTASDAVSPAPGSAGAG